MRPLLILFLSIAVSFAVPSEVEREALVTQAAQADVVRTVSYAITLTGASGFADLQGKTYPAVVRQETSGFFINGDGSLVTSLLLLDDSVLLGKALDRVEPGLILDMARVEHTKKYGADVRSEELQAYETYFQGAFGSLEDFYRAHPDSLKIEKLSEEISFELGEESFPATLQGSENGFAVLQAEGLQVPSIQLSDSRSVQKGDTLYMLPLPASDPSLASSSSPAIESVVVSDKTETDIQLSKSPLPGSLVINPRGDIVGAAIGLKGDLFKTSLEIEQALAHQNLRSGESPITQLYREGLEKYFGGDPLAAQQKFDQVLKSSPYLQDALLYRERAKELWEKNRSPIEQFQAHPWRDRILLGAGILLGVFVLRRLLR